MELHTSPSEQAPLAELAPTNYVVTSSKSWSLAMLYFLGAGLFGGHRLYLGRRWSAGLQMLSFVLPFVLVTIFFSGRFVYQDMALLKVAAALLFASLSWYVGDLLFLLAGWLSDAQQAPVKPAKGEWRWVWQSLLLALLLLALQVSTFLVFWGHDTFMVNLFRGDLLLCMPLWVLSTWAFSYIAVYVWQEWFAVKESGVLFLALPTLMVVWLSLYLCISSSVMMGYFSKNQCTIDGLGESLLWHYRASFRPLLFVLGFVTGCGLWMLVSMASSFVRKTDLYRRQSLLGWCVVAAYGFGLALLGGLTSALGLVVGCLLVCASIVMLAPPFRQKMGKGAPVHGQVRPVVSFSLLCFFVAGLAWLFEYLLAYLRYLDRLNNLKQHQPWLSPSSDVLQAQLIDWQIVAWAALCLSLVLVRVVWIHRAQLFWALREARWTFVSFCFVVFGFFFVSHNMSSWVLTHASWQFSSNKEKLASVYHKAALAPAFQEEMGLTRKVSEISSLLSMAQHFLGDRQTYERIWIGHKRIVVHGTSGLPIFLRKKEDRKLPMNAPLMFKLYLKQRRESDREEKRWRKTFGAYHKIAIAVDPAASMGSLCRLLQHVPPRERGHVWLQIPSFQRVKIADKQHMTISHWRSFKLVWGQSGIAGNHQTAKAVLYSKKLLAVLQAKSKVLRVCEGKAR